MIKILRLKSGEELLAKVTMAESSYMLEDVSLIIPTEKGIGLMDFMPYSDIPENGFVVDEDFIAWIVNPSEGLLNKYKTIYSKIITQNQSLII